MGKDYRKIYRDATGEKPDKNFVIHHLDFNRENNNILNLVCIPKELHIKYHSAKRNIEISHIGDDTKKEDFICPVTFLDGACSSLRLWELDKFYKDVQTLAKCSFEILEYIKRRNSLIGVTYNQQMLYEVGETKKRRELKQNDIQAQ